MEQSAPGASKIILELKIEAVIFNGLKQHITYSAAAAKSLQSSPTLCNPMDSSPPGSSVHEILQARILEWVPFPPPMHESEKRQ